MIRLCALFGCLLFWLVLMLWAADASSCAFTKCNGRAPDVASARKITNERGQQRGDIYNPGHGRRLQIRDNRRRILGYIERNGTVTDTRRRKIGRVK